jgi:hypothetical protein
VADADPGGRRPSIPSAGQDTVPKFARIVKLVERICRLAGDPDLIEESREDLVSHAVPQAIRRHDTATIFDWLFDAMSYQGLSDAAVYTYMERHGRVRWQEIGHLLEAGPRCPKLIGFETFVGCGYQKTSGRCACPELLSTCPLPSHDLRNGRLNQAAYSLFLFMRDIAGGDFVGWIDDQLARQHRRAPKACGRLCSSRSGMSMASPTKSSRWRSPGCCSPATLDGNAGPRRER